MQQDKANKLWSAIIGYVNAVSYYEGGLHTSEEGEEWAKSEANNILGILCKEFKELTGFNPTQTMDGLWVVAPDRMLLTPPSYIPQELALEMRAMLEGAGFGKAGQPNTFEAMLRAALGELEQLRKQASV